VQEFAYPQVGCGSFATEASRPSDDRCPLLPQ